MAEEKKVSVEESISCTSSENGSLKYHENSSSSFYQWDECRKPIELKCSGRYILSDTEKGKSIVFYEPNFFEEDEATELMNHLLNVTEWQMKNVTIRGIEYPQPRLVAWYGPFPYSYSGTTLEPAEMPDCILEVKKKVEEYLGKNGVNVTLNSVLLNLYRHNKDSVSWHSDDETSMGVFPTIASVSLGDTRRFEMRRKLKYFEDGNLYTEDDEYFVFLNNGSLLIMDGCMQKDWQHRVPKEHHIRHERINLTFRTVYKVESFSFLRSPGAQTKRSFKRVTKTPRKKISYEKTGTKTTCSDIIGKKRDLSSSKTVIEIKSHKVNTELPFIVEDKINEKICRDAKTNSCNQIVLKTENELNESDEKQDLELSYRKRSTLKNHFGDDEKNVKSIESNLNSSNDVININVTTGRNKRLCTNKQSNTTNSAGDFKIKSESAISADKSCTLNASFENSAFDSCEMKDLLNYNMDLMNGKLFFDYAKTLKKRVLETIDEFCLHEKSELEVLCRLTNGTQTKENQEIITKRMHSIVDKASTLKQASSKTS